MFGIGGDDGSSSGIHRICSHFGLLGAFVGKFLRISVLLALLIFVSSIVPYFLRVNTDFTLSEGFIATNAPSHKEVAVQRKFFGKKNEQWYMALFGVAKAADGNMLRASEYEEFNAFYENVAFSKEFNVDNVKFKYTDICKPLCDINGQFQKLMENSWISTMRYPVSQVLSYDVNIGKHVFNRTLDARTGELTGTKFLAYYFTVFLDDDLRRRQVKEFEIVVTRLAHEHNAQKGKHVEIITHGSHGVTNEIQRGVREWFYSLSYGIGIATAGALTISWVCGWYSDEQFTWRRVILALISLTLGIVTIVSALGYTLLFGAVINLLFITSPILTFVFLINFHGAFSIADAWSRLSGETRRKQFTASERLAGTFEQISLTYLLSNFTLFVAFLAAYFVLITNYGSYALFLAFIVLFNFIYQTLCYSALLVVLCYPNERHSERFNSAASFYAPANTPPPLTLDNDDGLSAKPSLPIAKNLLPLIIKKSASFDEKSGTKRKKSSAQKRKKTDFKEPMLTPGEQRRYQIRKRRQFRIAFSQRIFYSLSKYLSSRTTHVIVNLLFALLLWYSYQGIYRMSNRMDYRNILPQNSPSNRAFGFMDVIWYDILQIVYIVEKAPDFENATQYSEFRKFIHDVNTLPQAMAPRAHMSWIFDYYRDRLNLNYFANSQSPEKVNMTGFKDFIETFPYQAWQSGVRFVYQNSTNSKKPKIEKMLVLMAYNETVGLNGKLALMRQCRQIAEHYAQFNIVAFDTDSQTVDVIDAVLITSIYVVLGLVISGAVLCMIIFGHLLATLLTTFSICGLLLVFYGMAQQLVGFELDFLSAPAAWTIAAQVVYVGSQYTGNYLQCWAKEDQQRRALECTLSALWKITLLWLLIAAPQACTSLAPLFAVQARFQLIGVFVAFIFSLLLQPTHVSLIETCFGSRIFQ